MSEEKIPVGKTIIKGVLSLMSGIGIGVMMRTGVNVLTPETAGKLTKLCCNVGGAVLAGAVSRAACREIDALDNDLSEIKNNIATGVDMIAHPENYAEEPKNEIISIVKEEPTNAEE